MNITIILIGLTLLPIFLGLQRYANAYGYQGVTKEEAIKGARFAFKFGCVLSIFGFVMLMAGCTNAGHDDLEAWMHECFDRGGAVYMIEDQKLGNTPACTIPEKGDGVYNRQ